MYCHSLYYPFIIRSGSKTGEDKKKAKGGTGLSHSLFGSENLEEGNDDLFSTTTTKKMKRRYVCSHCNEKCDLSLSHTHTHISRAHNRNLIFLKTITLTYLMTH